MVGLQKTRRFVWFDGSTVGLNDSMLVWSQNGSLRWIESESSSIDGSTVRFGFLNHDLSYIYIYIPPWLKTWLGISHEKSSHGRLIPYHYTHEIILFGFIIFETVDHWAWGYVLVSIFHNFFNVAIGMIFTISPFSVITRLIIHLLPMHLIYNGFKCEAICFV